MCVLIDRFLNYVGIPDHDRKPRRAAMPDILSKSMFILLADFKYGPEERVLTFGPDCNDLLDQVMSWVRESKKSSPRFTAVERPKPDLGKFQDKVERIAGTISNSIRV